MREILFKAKSKDNGEWRCLTVAPYAENTIKIVSAYDDDDEIVDMDTLCQYTGLKDKNGKEIYENDIVRYQFDNDDCPFPNKHTEKVIGRIFFSDFRASFSVTAGRKGSSVLNNDLYKYVQNGNRVEVIGNIFDNSELLEAAE